MEVMQDWSTSARTTGANVTVLPTAAAVPPPNPTSRRGRYPKEVVSIRRAFTLLYQRREREKDAAARERMLQYQLQEAIEKQKAAIRLVAELSASLSARVRTERTQGDFA